MNFRAECLDLGFDGQGWYVVTGQGEDMYVVSGPFHSKAAAEAGAGSASAQDRRDLLAGASRARPISRDAHEPAQRKVIAILADALKALIAADDKGRRTFREGTPPRERPRT